MPKNEPNDAQKLQQMEILRSKNEKKVKKPPVKKPPSSKRSITVRVPRTASGKTISEAFLTSILCFVSFLKDNSKPVRKVEDWNSFLMT